MSISLKKTNRQNVFENQSAEKIENVLKSGMVYRVA